MLINRYYPLFLASFVLYFSVTSAFADTPAINQAAPVVTGKAADGSSINLANLRGKTFVLEWTNNGCAFVKKHYESGNIPELQKQAAQQGVIWLQVISSAPGQEGYVDGPTAKKLNAERNSTPANTILDPEGSIGKIYGASNTPQFFMIDPKGILIYKGGIDSIPSTDREDIAKAENYIKEALDELAAGKKISKSTTKPYGCSVKY